MTDRPHITLISHASGATYSVATMALGGSAMAAVPAAQAFTRVSVERPEYHPDHEAEEHLTPDAVTGLAVSALAASIKCCESFFFVKSLVGQTPRDGSTS